MKSDFYASSFASEFKYKSMESMKAAVYYQYGGPEVVRVSEMELPIPTKNEILVKVKATTVTTGDSVLRKGEPFAARFVSGLNKPKRPVLGHELAGEVMAIGSNVTSFKKGDLIFGTLGLNSGTHAEYVCIPENAMIAKIPSGLEYKKAAALPVGATTALYFLRKGQISRGQRVLIYGASGSVGSYAVQLAKEFGTHVSAVAGQNNEELVRKLGADNFLDYKSVDFTDRLSQYDLIFDSIGKFPYNKAKRNLKEKGSYVTTAVSASIIFQMAQNSVARKHRYFAGIIKENVKDLDYIGQLAANCKLVPVIDKVLPLDEIEQAYRIVDSGRKKGNLILIP